MQGVPLDYRLQLLEAQVTHLGHGEVQCRVHIDQLECVVQQGHTIVLGGEGIGIGYEIHLRPVAVGWVLGGRLGSLGRCQLLGRRLRLGGLLAGQLLARLLCGDHRLVLIGQGNALIEPQSLEDVQGGGAGDSEIKFANAVDYLEEFQIKLS